jgi:hypothetical protein
MPHIITRPPLVASLVLGSFAVAAVAPQLHAADFRCHCTLDFFNRIDQKRKSSKRAQRVRFTPESGPPICD